MEDEVYFCPKCHTRLVLKQKGYLHLFWACPKFPECRHTQPWYYNGNVNEGAGSSGMGDSDYATRMEMSYWE